MLASVPTQSHSDALESMSPPPPYPTLTEPKRRREVLTCYWILAVTPAWTSTLFTFSDLLYVEQRGAPAMRLLHRFAADMRGGHPAEYRDPEASFTPNVAEVTQLGIDPADARHVADAIALGCDTLLTFDLPLRDKGDVVAARWGLQLRRPSEFLIESVKA